MRLLASATAVKRPSCFVDVGELNTFARTIRQWETQFLNYFDSRATNARSEARNLTIKQVKRSGFGFRRFDNYRLLVLYRCR